MHDLSKFDALEFQHLWKGSKNFDIALLHHHCHNSHHPEHYKNSVWGMSDLDLAEYVADCAARGQEFGTDVRIWLLDKAADRYGYKNDAEIMNKIEMFVNMLLNKPFNKI